MCFYVLFLNFSRILIVNATDIELRHFYKVIYKTYVQKPSWSLKTVKNITSKQVPYLQKNNLNF